MPKASTKGRIVELAGSHASDELCHARLQRKSGGFGDFGYPKFVKWSPRREEKRKIMKFE
jgi:hypothetical protein